MSVKSQDPSLYRDRDVIPMRRALISVSDKTGLAELAEALTAAGVEIVSTGSTAAQLAAAGARVTEVAEVTGFPESLDGRVKTLHPAVHAGLLADLRLEAHEQELAELGIEAFQLVVVNLYPFREKVEAGADAATVVENIDIGGPAMVRAAAKNHANVAIVVDPSDYPAVIGSLAEGSTLAQRTQLAAKAFRHTADYDTAVAEWFASQEAASAAEWSITGPQKVASAEVEGTFRRRIELSLDLVTPLRYGENPHQSAALYRVPGETAGIAAAQQLHGKEMSYNNYVDADSALRAAYDFERPAVAIIKHANPCGIAVGADIAEAHARAHATDPVSAFGGVIAANRVITEAAARQIAPIFTEVVIAPGFEPAALEVLGEKKNIRLLVAQPQGTRAELSEGELRQISGGMLAQAPDRIDADGDSAENWTLVAGEAADESTLTDLQFAWRAVRAVKSNGILLAAGGAAVGVGMGQVNRVDSCRLAISRAGDRAAGSVAASDAFFPFADGPELLFAAGVRAVVQPGGSIRDAEVFAAATAAGVTMYTTGTRHFFH